MKRAFQNKILCKFLILISNFISEGSGRERGAKLRFAALKGIMEDMSPQTSRRRHQ